MKKDSKLWYWVLAFLVFEALILAYSYYFQPDFLLAEIIFLVLGIGATYFLSEILLTWLIILSFGLGVIILVAGVVYIPLSGILVLLFSYPLLLGILSQIHKQLYKHTARIQVEEDRASQYYDTLLSRTDFEGADAIQALLIHWSHEEQFFQLAPREYNRMIHRLYHKIKRQLSRSEQLFYVSEGNFLVLSTDDSRGLQEFYQTELLGQLKELEFTNGEDSHQAIQFQSGFLEIDKENKEKFDHYGEMVSNLQRQLETDIIVEY